MIEQDAICPQCSGPLTSEAPAGLCPRCVMRMNMAPETMEMESGAIPPVAELAPHFPQLEILECLGRGGMGIVYKARQPQLDRFVALKILAPERLDDVRFAERFRREGVSLARLDHPNIVTVFDTGVAGGFYYLLMEFVDGLNLREALAGERMSASEALAIVPPICAGLQYAHEQGVVHRDIKPENVLLDRRGRVKIADFGVAKLVCGPEDTQEGKEADASDDSGLTLGEKLGTPQYMAPEQEKMSGGADHRSDIYALGVVLYEMLTGEHPAKDLIAPSRKVEVDVRIDEIVLRALEKEPKKRYQTAGEFRTMVETLVEGSASQAESVELPAVERRERFPRKYFTGKLALVCLSALLVSAIIGAYVWVNDAKLLREKISEASHDGLVLDLKNRTQGLSEADRLGFQISGIKSVILQDSKVTVEDLALVGSHPEIESLNLGCTLRSEQPQISDEMLLLLAGNKELRTLQLAGNPISDAGLEHLASLPNLEKLQLGGTKVTGVGLQYLAHLTWLRLDATPINDAGLKYVGRMRELEQLYLDLTGITDAGLIHLYGLKKLRVLNLHDTKVTAEGVAALKRAIPGISVGGNAEVLSGVRRPGEFGEVLERTLERNSELKNCFLDVESGHVLSASVELVTSLQQKGKLFKGGPQVTAISDWARRHRVDFWLRSGEENKLLLLEGICIRDSHDFEDLNAVKVRANMEELSKVSRGHVEQGFHMGCDFALDHPDGNTWIFRTREGVNGALEIIPAGNPSESVRIRFKLITPEADQKMTDGVKNDAEATAAADAARGFLEAVAALDVEQALGFVEDDRRDYWRQGILTNGRQLAEEYSEDLTRLSLLTSWYHRDGYAVGRVATPLSGDGTQSLYLILQKSSAEWKVIDFNDIKTSDRLKEKLKQFQQRRAVKSVDLAQGWAGHYRGTLGSRKVEWRIVNVAGDYHWLPGSKSKVSEHNLLRHVDGGLGTEDAAEKFRFDQRLDGGLRFQMWAKAGGKKMGEVVLRRIKEEVSDEIEQEQPKR